MPLANVTGSEPAREPVWGAQGDRVTFECQRFPDGTVGFCTFENKSTDTVPVLVLTPEAVMSLLDYLVNRPSRLN